MFKHLCLLVLWLHLGLLGAVQIFVINSESRTLSRIDTETGAVNNSFAALSLTPNRMIVSGDSIFVACSGSNGIQVISATSGQTLRQIFIAASSNPWDMLLHGGYLYVTGYFTDMVYKVDMQSCTVVDQVNVGTSPEGMTVCNGKLYVGNTGGYAAGYANSSVSVIELESFAVIKTIPVWHNPQDLQAFGNEVHVACTGDWDTISGAVDIIDTNIDERRDRIIIGGNPWSLWISPQGIAYVGEGYNSGVYSYHATTHVCYNNATNPLLPGAVAVHGNYEYLTVLSANWGTNGSVYVRDHSWMPVAQYTVGLLPTDLWCMDSGSATEDEQQAHSGVFMYPNPVSRNGNLSVVHDSKVPCRVELYNLKGQRVFSGLMSPDTQGLSLAKLKLAPGMYFYRINAMAKGKLVVF